jgi:hypothetical protein
MEAGERSYGAPILWKYRAFAQVTVGRNTETIDILVIKREHYPDAHNGPWLNVRGRNEPIWGRGSRCRHRGQRHEPKGISWESVPPLSLALGRSRHVGQCGLPRTPPTNQAYSV